ncbi:MAG: thioredoxin family protein [Campylobacterota bacterium]
MHKYFLILIFITTSLFAEINWEDDYKSALKKAKTQNKKVMLMFSTEDCKECQNMYKTVYADKKVSKYVNTHFIAVDIDVEYDGRKGFKVYKTPTFYFLDPKGEQIGRAVKGALGKGTLLKKLQEIAEGK